MNYLDKINETITRLEIEPLIQNKNSVEGKLLDEINNTQEILPTTALKLYKALIALTMEREKTIFLEFDQLLVGNYEYDYYKRAYGYYKELKFMADSGGFPDRAYLKEAFKFAGETSLGEIKYYLFSYSKAIALKINDIEFFFEITFAQLDEICL